MGAVYVHHPHHPLPNMALPHAVERLHALTRTGINVHDLRGIVEPPCGAATPAPTPRRRGWWRWASWPWAR